MVGLSSTVNGLHLFSEVLFGSAAIVVAASLTYLVYRSRNLPFRWLYLSFGVFIVGGAVSHALSLWTVWRPDGGWTGRFEVVTALASLGTAVLVLPLMPQIVGLIRSVRMAHERGVSLETAFLELGTVCDKTRRLEALQSQFFANVSCALRTPVTHVMGSVESLLTSEVTPSQRLELENVQQNARLLLKQVNDLLDTARLEAGRMPLSYVRTDLVALLAQATSLFGDVWRDRQLSLSVEAPTALIADVDPDKLQRIVVHLLGNAITHTPIGGRIHCALVAQGAEVRLSVADSGPGIPLAERQSVFERFVQGDVASTSSPGRMGLGLAIVKEFTGLMGGHVQVDTAPEGGALFMVTLPRTAQPGMPVDQTTSWTGDPATAAAVLAWHPGGSQADASQTIAALQSALDQAEREHLARGRFLHMVSHELRSPVAALQLLFESVSRQQARLPLREQQMVRRMGGSLGRLWELIETLLDYTEVEGGLLRLSVAPVAVGVLAGDVVTGLRERATAKGLALHLVEIESGLTVATDARLVRLVLGHLLSNAIKYTDAGEVVVSVGSGPQGVELTVKDSGPGIPLDRQALIFEPFAQLETVAHKHQSGVGLGLALVQAIVRRLGGQIKLTSQPGQGSTFALLLPAGDRQALPV